MNVTNRCPARPFAIDPDVAGNITERIRIILHHRRTGSYLIEHLRKQRAKAPGTSGISHVPDVPRDYLSGRASQSYEGIRMPRVWS